MAVYGALRLAAGFNSAGPYRQGVGVHTLGNLGRLGEFATDLAILGRAHVTFVVAVAFWATALALVVWATLRRWPQAAAGLVWALIAVFPVIVPANQTMSDYYIDFALPGLGLAAGAIIEHTALLGRRWLPGAIVAGAFTYLAVAGFVVGRLETVA